MVRLLLTKNINYFFLLLLLSTAIGFFAIKFLANPLVGDEIGYDEVAISIVNNQSYPIVGHILLPPGLPFFLAIIYFIFGHSYAAVYFIQFILISVIGYAFFLIGKKQLNLQSWQALLPALTIIFWPYFIFYGASVLTEILFTFFTAWTAYFLLELWKNPNSKNAIMLGIFGGFGALTRPTNLLLLPWILFFLIIFLIKKKTFFNNTHFKKAVLAIIIFSATILPWTIYATIKTGVFTPVTSTLEEIYNKDNKTYNYEWSHYKTPGYEPDAEIKYSKLIAIKLRNIYRFWKSGASGAQAKEITDHNPRAVFLITAYRTVFYSLLAFFFLSIAFYRKQNITILWLVVLYFWILHIILHPYPRYTLPIIPIMIVLAFYTFFNINYFKKYFYKNADKPQTKNL